MSVNHKVILADILILFYGLTRCLSEIDNCGGISFGEYPSTAANLNSFNLSFKDFNMFF